MALAFCAVYTLQTAFLSCTLHNPEGVGRMGSPTQHIYSELQHAYDVLNVALFEAQLPPCLITLQRPRRSVRSSLYGYFCGVRWQDQSGVLTAEIALDPRYFGTQSTEAVLSTLAHEMVHLWQHHDGHPSRTGYHNREFADKTESIGLCPSQTGQPGGERTGHRMDHYIVEGGPFAQACVTLLAEGFALSWRDLTSARPLESPGKAGRSISSSV